MNAQTKFDRSTSRDVQHFATSAVVKMGEGDNRRVRFAVSTENPDRDGDVVMQSGWMLDNFRKQPVVLYNHDRWSLPVGRCTEIGVQNNELVAEVEFATHDFAEEVYQLVQSGTLNSVSAGFIPTGSTPRTDNEGNFIGHTFTGAELLEFSIVNIPSNTSALRKAFADGNKLDGLRDHMIRRYENLSKELAEVAANHVRIFGEVHPGQQAELRERNYRTKEDKRTLYMKRDVLNGQEIADWAKAAGFTSTLPPEDMHVTLAFSREKVDWSGITAKSDEVTIVNGERAMKALGEDGEAIVLRISDEGLESRWSELCEMGCSWDHDGYQPHVTLSYKGAPDNWAALAAYSGEVKLGPEVMSEVKENWQDDIDERSAPERIAGAFDPETLAAMSYTVKMSDDGLGVVTFAPIKAAPGTVITTTGGDGHEHTYNLGEDETQEAGDPPHRHAITYNETGQATIMDAEGHSHEPGANAQLDVNEDGTMTEASETDGTSADDKAIRNLRTQVGDLTHACKALMSRIELIETGLDETGEKNASTVEVDHTEILERLAPEISTLVTEATIKALQARN